MGIAVGVFTYKSDQIIDSERFYNWKAFLTDEEERIAKNNTIPVALRPCTLNDKKLFFQDLNAI